MNALITEPFLVSLLFGAVTAGLPLLFAGLGEQISEKAGVLNIGLEGMMLAGAYSGFLATYHTGSFWLGFLAGGLGGMAVALIVLMLCIRKGLNQIVIGIAITVGAQGLTSLLHFVQFSRTYPRLPAAPVLALPLLARYSHPRQGVVQPQRARKSQPGPGRRAHLGVVARPTWA